MPDERDAAVDIDEIQTLEDVITWLRTAADVCTDTAQHTRNPEGGAYLKGRAEAFRLSARMIEDAREHKGLGLCGECAGVECGCLESPAECGRREELQRGRSG